MIDIYTFQPSKIFLKKFIRLVDITRFLKLSNDFKDKGGL